MAGQIKTRSTIRVQPARPLFALEIGALVLILLLAAYLRLPNNAHNPGWYSDEGTHIDIARHLAAGQVQYMAIGDSTLLFARLPLFETILAAAFKAIGPGMQTLRTLTGLLGLISVATLYGIVRRIGGEAPLALLAAFFLAIYPQAVIYSRFGFSYNLLTPLVLLVFWSSWEYLQRSAPETGSARRWLALAALAIGLGGVSDLWIFGLLAPLILVVLARRWQDLLWSLPLAVLPFGLYAGLALLRTPEAFLFDLGFTLSRLGKLPLLDQLRTLALNYTTLALQENWFGLALVGTFLLRPARLQRLTWLFLLLPIAVLGRNEALYSLSFYYMIPLLPLVALGLAGLLREGTPHALRLLRASVEALVGSWTWLPEARRNRFLTGSAGLLLLLALLSPFLTSMLHSVDQVSSGFQTAIDPFLVKPQDAQPAAEFVNRRVSADDLVIASPGLGWIIQANVADFQMSSAFGRQATPHIPANLPRDRFVFAPDYDRAQFVIVDNLWHNWGRWNVAGVAEMLEQIETWPMVFRSGAIRVYCNAGRYTC
ncbi:MAG: glycosyltransferase family 39 protein [Anaerolineae bacterium]